MPEGERCVRRSRLTTRAQEVLDLALQLDRADRAALAARVLASLDDDDKEVDPEEWERA